MALLAKWSNRPNGEISKWPNSPNDQMAKQPNGQMAQIRAAEIVSIWVGGTLDNLIRDFQLPNL